MDLCVTIPVLNEEKRLRKGIARLHSFLSKHITLNWEIVIANNGSTDQTLQIARALAQEYSNVRVFHSEQKGRGRALKQVWMESHANILSYMDADLSTDLDAFPALIRPLISGAYEVATGSRLLKPVLTTRSLKRECTSRFYNILVRILLRTHFSDAQCGFKAMTRKAGGALLPIIQDQGWFFDTELLVVAERLSYKIFELPVRWVENPDTRVKIIQTAIDDIKGLLRLRRELRHDTRRNSFSGEVLKP